MRTKHLKPYKKPCWQTLQYMRKTLKPKCKNMTSQPIKTLAASKLCRVTIAYT